MTTTTTAKPPRTRVSSADAFASKVAAQPVPRGNAVLIAQGLASCAVSTATLAGILGTDRENVEGFLLGGLTTLTAIDMGYALDVLYRYKLAGLDTLRGKEQASVLALVHGLVKA